MSDLLSPLLFVMKNEVDAFWCFVGFMDRVASNFEFDQVGLWLVFHVCLVDVFFAGRHEEATGGVVPHLEVCRPCLLQLPWCKGSSVIPYSYSLTQITMTCVIFSFQESGNLYFCFRWLLIWFKREFSFPDTCSLWEALWTKMWVQLLVRYTIGRLHYSPSNIKGMLIHSFHYQGPVKTSTSLCVWLSLTLRSQL